MSPGATGSCLKMSPRRLEVEAVMPLPLISCLNFPVQVGTETSRASHTPISRDLISGDLFTDVLLLGNLGPLGKSTRNSIVLPKLF